MTDGSPFPTVGVEVLLRPDHQGAEAAHAAAIRLEELGLEVSAVGEASLTLELSHDAFNRMFGRAPTSPDTHESFGSWVEPSPLQVPDEMAPWVASLSEARPAKHF